MGIIACGVFDKKYLIFFFGYALTMILLGLSLVLTYGYIDKSLKIEYFSNILLTLLVSNFGQIFLFIPELILKNNLVDKNEKKSLSLKSLHLFKKEEKKKIAIEYIFNDLTDRITNKDIIFIFLISILLLIVDYIKVFIQVKNNESKVQLILSEHYIFVELFFIVVFAYLFYKMKFYKHQIFSILIIILLGIIRYVIKMYYIYNICGNKYLIIEPILQIFAAIFESIAIIYAKGLMEYKYFSPYKTCYIPGIINTIIILIFLLIFNFIKTKEGNWFFSLKYNNEYYLDNINSILNYGYKLIGLLFASIFYGVLKLFLNLTINKFTVCHAFLLLQNREFIYNFMTEIITQKHIIFVIIIVISYIIDFFIVLVFLEIIELRFCGLDDNIKRNIKDRADLETRRSLENKNEDDERYQSLESINDDNNL